ncbi:MAG: Mov34/MPN/PAD-1 family protein [Bryobacteraceae bacterium]|jgi:integrative and conjugative element protein (TIGR02256 family)
MNFRIWRSYKELGPDEGGKIIFARGVLDFIESQVIQAREELETGGLLLGSIGPRAQRVVLAASPAGPAALHHPVMFERDLEFSQFMLNEAYDLHKLEYLGEWHKHPRTCTEPSGGDEDGCRSILTDPAYKIAGLMLFPIFTLKRTGGVDHHYYCMDRSLTYRVFCPIIEDREHFMPTVLDLERRYLARPRCSPSASTNTQVTLVFKSDLSLDRTAVSPQWYDSDAGRRYLLAATTSLRAKGLDLDTRSLADGRLALIIKGPKGQQVTVICDKNHPSQAPVVQVTAPSSWDGSSSLADFMAEIHQFFSRCGRDHLDVSG